MITVNHVLSGKPSQVFSVSPQTTVFEALEVMMNKNISALVVMEKNELCGIFTERDYARKIVLKGKSSKDTPVSEIMTAELITVDPADSIDYCMKIMTEKHIRHLPVVQNTQVLGMLSIGDAVKSIIEVQRSTIEQLQTYISS
ncbi:CBS domain-containing protein [Pedobacter sp. P351]|uniref:CBS domain-containing protein n=1 Tax=Pedobacter superstes TaxID=3133441 RepID=UPI0030A53B4A